NGAGPSGTGPPAATPLLPRLAADRRLLPAGALPRGHVLRILGLAHQQPAAGGGAGAGDAAHRAVAAVPAVPGLGHGDRVPGCPRPPRGPGRFPLHGRTLAAPAAAAGDGDAGGGAAAVLLPGAGQPPRRL